jgi:hypothetical protein
MGKTMKDHLAEVHSHIADLCKGASEHFDGLAKCLGKADTGDAKEAHKHLTGLAKKFGTSGEFMSECADSVAKAAAAEELAKSQIVPSHVSAVAPTAPPRAVPRFGQREPVGERPIVPLQFQKLVMTVDEEMAEADAQSGLQ